MRFLRTQLATDWPETEASDPKGVRRLSLILATPGPAYTQKLHLVEEWLIEFDEAGVPWREVGLSKEGEPVVAGPDAQTYGFWCDTNMRWGDFDGQEISAEVFEEAWGRAVRTLGLV
ncbi:MAG: hypothetical protein AAGI08_12670 [Bacteroidota bacterium]